MKISKFRKSDISGILTCFAFSFGATAAAAFRQELLGAVQQYGEYAPAAIAIALMVCIASVPTIASRLVCLASVCVCGAVCVLTAYMHADDDIAKSALVICIYVLASVYVCSRAFELSPMIAALIVGDRELRGKAFAFYALAALLIAAALCCTVFIF